MCTDNRARNRKILARRGKKSFGLIAEELGVTRNIVAGVMFREDWPRAKRVNSPNGRRNKSGTGRGAQGIPARRALRNIPHEARP